MTALKFYLNDNSLHEWENLQYFHGNTPVVLRCGTERLIPFCHSYDTLGETIDDVIIEYLDGSELTLDSVLHFEVTTDGILDWITYNGDEVESGGDPLDAGLARIVIELSGGNILYSDYFEICDLDQTLEGTRYLYDDYFNIFFRSDCDLVSPANILYSGGYENHLAFDALPIKPDSQLNIEGEVDEALGETIHIIANKKTYQVEILGGESLFDALSILRFHEYIYVSWPGRGLTRAYNIEFQYDWVDDFLCHITLKFNFENLKKGGCCEDFDIDDQYFTTEWETENAGSATKTIVIPTAGAGYNCLIDWGDGNKEIVTGTPGNITHVYATAGTKTVKIRGAFPRIGFNNGGDKLKITKIVNWGTGAWSSMQNAFYGCANLTGTYTDIPDTSAVTNMTYMFIDCLVFNSAVGFDTSQVTDMEAMFFGCSAFNQPVPFDTSSVTNMRFMFLSCLVFNQSLAAWDIQLVTNMTDMFNGANALSTANYDALLISWGAQAVQNNVNFHAGDATYTQDSVDSGTTDGAAANKLIQSGQNFDVTVTIGDVVHNTTDDTYAIVTNIDSPTQLAISVDIMANGENFVIQNGAAAKARAHLVITHTWTITDAGPV